jgi:hypothetical protein
MQINALVLPDNLYNIVFGENENAELFKRWLDLKSFRVGRYRDIWLDMTAKNKGRIILLTRNGGGNREYQKDAIESLRGHALYIKDYDEEYDPTYAIFEFSIPPENMQHANRLRIPRPKSFQARWEDFHQEMNSMSKKDILKDPRTSAFAGFIKEQFS